MNSKDIEFIFTKIRKNRILTNLKYKNLNFRINILEISNISIISYLLYKYLL
jgi:hypothetical protein